MTSNTLNTLHFGKIMIITKYGVEYFITKEICNIFNFSQTCQLASKVRDIEKDTLTYDEAAFVGKFGRRGVSIVSRRGVHELLKKNNKLRTRLEQCSTAKHYLELFEVLDNKEQDELKLPPSPFSIEVTENDKVIEVPSPTKKVKVEKTKKTKEELIEVHPVVDSPVSVVPQKIKEDNDLLSQVSNLKEVFTKIEEQLLEINELKAKLKVYDQITHSENSITFNTFVSILKQNGVDTDRQTFINYLKESGYLLSGTLNNNLPSEVAMDLGLFEISQDTIGNKDAGYILLTPTYITTTGQEFFLRKLIP